MSGHEKRELKPLGKVEAAVLSLIWKDGSMTAEAVRKGLAPERVLKDATVRTVLRRLESKGCLEHKIEGRTYVYRAVEPPQNIVGRAVQDLANRYCNGKMEKLLEAMLEAGLVNRRDLKRAGKRH